MRWLGGIPLDRRLVSGGIPGRARNYVRLKRQRQVTLASPQLGFQLPMRGAGPSAIVAHHPVHMIAAET